jgi:DNA-binding CsgD family transcriptional regulator
MRVRADYAHLVHQPHGVRYQYLVKFYMDTLITADSVYIFNTINQVKQLAQDNNDEDLLMEAKFMRAHYFFTRSFYNGKIPVETNLAIFNEVLKEAQDKHILWAEAWTEDMLAFYYYEVLQEYELAFEHYNHMYQLLKDMKPKDFPHKLDCLNQLGNQYYTFGDYRQAIFYNLEALKNPHPFKFFTRGPYDIYNTLGLSYQQLNMLDSSDYYFNKLLGLARNENNLQWEGIATGNIGHNFFTRNEYDKAIPYLEKDIEVALQYKDTGLASVSLMLLTQIHFNQGDYRGASTYLSQARQYAYRSKQYSRLKNLYPLMSKLYAAQNKPILSAIYLDSAIYVKDSLDKQFNILQLTRLRQKAELSDYKGRVELVENRRKLFLIQRNILIALVIVMMLSVVFFYRLYLHKQKVRQEQIASATKQLNDFARHISEKNALIEVLEHRNENADVIQQLQKSTILTDNDWTYFRDLFEKVHMGFFTRLKEKLPGLTPAEIRFLALTRLGLSNKEMAAMLGIGTDAVRKNKSRIRKKLNIAEDDNLEELVMQI